MAPDTRSMEQVAPDHHTRNHENSSANKGFRSPSIAEKATPQHAAIPAQAESRVSVVLDHFRAPIRICYLAEIELYLLTFCTGMQDATTFPDYRCFASNQTGNTIMLTLAVALPSLAGSVFFTANIGISLAFFLLGGLVTGQVSHRLVNARSRGWLVFCNLLQTVLVLAAAAVQFRFGVQTQGVHAKAVLVMLAFASGSQVVLSRTLAMTEITTAVATAAWVDVMIDANLFRLENRSRNRRLIFLVTLVAGSFVGAGIYRTAGSPWAISISGMGKLVATFMFMFNRAETKEQEEDVKC